MDIRAKNTVLLVFARSLPEEVRHKPLLNKKGADRYLYRQFNSHLKDTLNKTGLPVIWWDSRRQVRSTFAENFKEAFRYAFSQNYQQVIAIGNDCLTLNYRDVLIAARQLQQKEFVLGPATDGGIYLMGISRNAFNSDIFNQIRWQTGHVYHDLQKNMSPSSVFCLTLKSDIDSLADLQAISSYRSIHIIALRIYLYLITLRSLCFEYIIFYQSTLYKRSHNLRAPPPLINFSII